MQSAPVVESERQRVNRGLFALGVAMTGVMLLIGDFLFGRTAGLASGLAAALPFAAAWWALPVRERRRSAAVG